MYFSYPKMLVYKQENNRNENIRKYMSMLLKDDFLFLNNSQSQETQTVWLFFFSPQDSISFLGGRVLQLHIYLTVCSLSSPPSLLLVSVSRYILILNMKA